MGRAGTGGRRTSEPRDAAVAEWSDAGDESTVNPLSGTDRVLWCSRSDETGTDSNGGEATRGNDDETGSRNAGAEVER